MTAFRLEGRAERAAFAVESSLRLAAQGALDRGLGVPEISGKLLRPMVAWALVPGAARRTPDAVFGAGALAIQMVHEASLLHDDILDGAERRRGVPSLQVREGLGAALVTGDRYLTSAYVVACDTGSAEFTSAFARAVERTVAGEMRQAASRGRMLSESAYESIVRGKSGELFGAAAALASIVGGEPVPAELGLRIGSLYQRIDDLLDYCTGIAREKPPLQDWRQRKWTFLLGVAGVTDWTLGDAELLAALRSGPEPPLMKAVRALDERAARIAEEAARFLGDAELLGAILASWCAAARRGVERELASIESDGLPRPMEQAS